MVGSCQEEKFVLRLILVGYRASGKTTIAQSLSDQFDCPAIDADDVFEQMYSCAIGEFIENQGEMSFRDAETVVLKQLLRLPDGVLSTGGGIVLREENRRMIEAAGLPVVWLMAPADEIRRRLASDTTTARRRPALEGKDVYSEVDQALVDREPFYRSVAHFRVDTKGATVPAIVEKIAGWLAAWEGAASRSGDTSAGANS